MNEHSQQLRDHILWMKLKAKSCSNQAVRAKKEFRFLAIAGFVIGCGALAVAIWFGLTVHRFFFALSIPSIAFFFIARSAWNSANKFYIRWMEIREEALGYAKEAEGRL
jgi:hypothetical protein